METTFLQETEIMDEKEDIVSVKLTGRYARALKEFGKNCGESSNKAAMQNLIRRTAEYKNLEQIEQPELAGFG